MTDEKTRITKKILPKNKKGSHVGIIVSFTLFITSVIFIYSIATAPLVNSNEKYEVIDHIKNNFVQYNSENIFIMRLDDQSSSSCVKFSKPVSNFDAEQVFARPIDSSSEVGSSISGSNIVVNSNSGPLKIILSNSSINKNLEQSDNSCDSINLYSFSERKILTEKSIINTLNEFESDYTGTKMKLGIPNDHDIIISFESSDGTVTQMRGIEVKENIYVNKYNVEYLSLNGNEKIGYLTIKVW